MRVIIDTASKLSNSSEIIAEGINLAYKHLPDERTLGWTRCYDGKREELELNLVGDENNLERIMQGLNKKINVSSTLGSYKIAYKNPPPITTKLFFKSFKGFKNGSIQQNELDSCLLSDYLALNKGVAIHFNDTAQARLSNFRINKNKTVAIGLLSSILKLGGKLQEPLIIADAGMQLETTKEEMLLNSLYCIATAKVMGIKPKIIFGSISDCADQAIKSYNDAYQSLDRIKEKIGVELLGFGKTYNSLNSEATIHLDSGRCGNEFPNNVNQGTKLMKEMMKEMIKNNIRNGTVFQKIKMSALGILLNLSKNESMNYKKELELNLRSIHGHLLGTNSFKIHSNINPVIVASAILGAYDFGHVKDEYLAHIEDMKPHFEKELGKKLGKETGFVKKIINKIN